MINKIKQLFGLGPKPDYAGLVKEGAIILDVRSKGEYSGGHIKGSINISVDTLKNNLNKIKDKNKPIITCCRSGNRSDMAKSILISAGIECYNGGAWNALNHKIS